MAKMIASVLVALGVAVPVAATEPRLVKLICPMKDHNGQSSFTAEPVLDEENGTVSMGTLKVPASFSPASVVWYVQTPNGPPGGFRNFLDRYSGEYTISFVNPTTGDRLVPHSGLCARAEEAIRKF